MIVLTDRISELGTIGVMEMFRADNLVLKADSPVAKAGFARRAVSGAVWTVPWDSASGEPASAWERSIYQPSRRFQGPAALGSLAVVATLLGAFLFLNVGGSHHRHRNPRMVSLDLAPPPAPPRQQRQAPRHAEVKPEQPQIIAPPPKLTLASAPPKIATAPQPAPPVVILAPIAPRADPAPAVGAAPTVTQGGDLSAKMIFAKPPTYPLDSRRAHEQGTVVLSLTLSTDGLVSEISVARSSGSDRLDQAALAAVRKWRWAPVIRDGQPVLVKGQVSIPFVLTH